MRLLAEEVAQQTQDTLPVLAHSERQRTQVKNVEEIVDI